ncbi:hypothetical protein [uncultured Campylobacter sp.]|uniref:hypothetical protein n=1 Tax=uncultured Campylobacter sp. TaxID=218934 RepID=UPI002615AA92|nr:hypothetical protein [uncultured Campylobacter sp.]
MNEQIIYFFRKKPYFFYSFFPVFGALYSFVLAILFLKWSPFKTDIFIVLFFLSALWFAAFYLSYAKTLPAYKFEREKEKFTLLEARVISDFSLSDRENIFKKIEAVRVFVRKIFSDQSLVSVKILSLINKTLFLYIENLSIIKSLNAGLSAVTGETKKEQIVKKAQAYESANVMLLEYLDSYISELAANNRNDKETASVRNELERMLVLLKNINKK